MSKPVHGHDTPSEAGYYNGIAGTAFSSARSLGRGEVDPEALQAQKRAAHSSMMLQAAAPVDPAANPHDRLRVDQFDADGARLVELKPLVEAAKAEVSRTSRELGASVPEPQTQTLLVVGTLAVALLPAIGLHTSALAVVVAPVAAFVAPVAALAGAALYMLGLLGAARDDAGQEDFLTIWLGTAVLGAAATVLVWLPSPVLFLSIGAGLFQLLVMGALVLRGQALRSAWQRHRDDLPGTTLRRQALADAQRVLSVLEAEVAARKASRQDWNDEVERRTHLLEGAKAHARAAEDHAELGFLMGVGGNYGDMYGAHEDPPSELEVRNLLRRGRERPVLDDA